MGLTMGLTIDPHSQKEHTRFPSLVLIRLVLTEIQRFNKVKINKEMYGNWTLCRTESGWPYISW